MHIAGIISDIITHTQVLSIIITSSNPNKMHLSSLTRAVLEGVPSVLSSWRLGTPLPVDLVAEADTESVCG